MSTTKKALYQPNQDRLLFTRERNRLRVYLRQNLEGDAATLLGYGYSRKIYGRDWRRLLCPVDSRHVLLFMSPEEAKEVAAVLRTREPKAHVFVAGTDTLMAELTSGHRVVGAPSGMSEGEAKLRLLFQGWEHLPQFAGCRWPEDEPFRGYIPSNPRYRELFEKSRTFEEFCALVEQRYPSALGALTPQVIDSTQPVIDSPVSEHSSPITDDLGLAPVPTSQTPTPPPSRPNLRTTETTVCAACGFERPVLGRCTNCG